MLFDIFLFVISLLLYLFIKSKKHPNLPPGKHGWPIIGAFPSFDIPFYDQIEINRKKYGDVFLWRIGSRNIVFLCDPKIIRKTFNNHQLLNRPNEHYTFDAGTYFKKIGITNSNGVVWQTHRRFVLHHLRDSGFGKSSLEEIVHWEAETLVEDIRENFLNKPTEIPNSINVATLNVITKLSTGLRFLRNDKKSEEILEALRSIIKTFQGLINIFDAFPWLVPIIPTSVLNFIGLKKHQRYVEVIQTFLKNVIEERKTKLDREDPNGFIDSYLMEMESVENTENIYNDEALISTLADLLIAGSDTTAITTEWILQYIACNPDIQKKIQEQIDDVVPRDRFPSLGDKSRLPFMEATINEGLRISSLTAVGLFREAREDTKIEQYSIPKGTIVCPYLYGCHTDPKYWEKPHDFYPEHFLDSDGKFTAKNDGFLPFSCGRRVCLGESLARTELFLYITSLLQNFNLSTPEGGRNRVERSPESKIFMIPSKLKIILSERP